ncbi:MAG TPA: hypothetical protein VMY37_08935 [Thermoguttaceae bacterium]|nr:hypothetical protein [Thermoguttaceae bacterium]
MTPAFRAAVKTTAFVRKLLILGAYMLFGVYGVAMYVLTPPDLLAMNHAVLISIWVVLALPLCAYFYSRDIGGQIARSRQRMADPSYRAKLIALGYAKHDSSWRE